MLPRLAYTALIAGLVVAGVVLFAQDVKVEYRVLATTRTGTMEKEMNDAAQAGFRIASVMGGETAVGGKEVVVVMSRPSGPHDQYRYKLLATNKTSTMQKELQDAGELGFDYREQTVFESAFGGREVVCILERNMDKPGGAAYQYRLLATNKTGTMQKELQEVGQEGFDYRDQTVFNTTFGDDEVVVILEADRQRSGKVRYEYKLLATQRTSTMQKELQEAGDAGFKFVGVTVSKTTFGGKEVVSILRKEIAD